MTSTSFCKNKKAIHQEFGAPVFALSLFLGAVTGCSSGGSPDAGPQNIPPSADAGIDQTVDEKTTVTLSGSGTDSDGSITGYAWVQTGGTSVSLTGSSSVGASFMAPNISSVDDLVFELTVTDNDGAKASDSVTVSVDPIFVEVDGIPFEFSNSPEQSAKSSITLLTDEDVGVVEWIVVHELTDSDPSLLISSDNKTATFTPADIGNYDVVVRSESGSTQIGTNFWVSPVFPFDEAKVEGNDGIVDISEIIGLIRNQAWVSSITLSEQELRLAIVEYAGLSVVGYDPIHGLLVEFDESVSTNLEAIEELKIASGIAGVHNRVYEGENAPRWLAIEPPDDGSDSAFDDSGGANWHLEVINVLDAWEHTTGSPDIMIGVSDAGYDASHDSGELSGRFAQRVANLPSATVEDRLHGNATAGTIGAETDSCRGVVVPCEGMGGVNWHSRMVLGLGGLLGLNQVLTNNAVEVTNSSWVISEHLEDSFNPENALSRLRRFTKAQAVAWFYRNLALLNKDKLLVWAAGNGIGNGAIDPLKTTYGVDARFENGALHYANYLYHPLSNVMVVAAMTKDGYLTEYSAYGRSVDIASPTSFKSLSADGQFLNGVSTDYGDGRTGYTGTSAAAPVVTGVASLVYSLYPEFSGAEVKRILLDSAGPPVYERLLKPGLTTQSNRATLVFPIPVLDAGAALTLAQQIIDSKVMVSDSISNPFDPIVRLSFSSIDEDFEIIGVEWEVQSSIDGGVTWVFVNGASTIGDVVDSILDAATAEHRVLASITLRNINDGSETTGYREHGFSYQAIRIIATDTVTLAPLEGVTIGLEVIAGPPIGSTGVTDLSGVELVFLESGSYKVYGTVAAYQDSASTITVNSLQSQQVNLNMTPDAVVIPVGSLSGTVVDTNGFPIIGASVRISGGAQTNGFFASAITDFNGYYVISNITKVDTSGVPIDLFTLEVSAVGHTTVVKEDVIVLAGKQRSENFTLVEQDVIDSTSFSDDFEIVSESWTATGFWNRVDLSSVPIANTLVDGGFSLLPPDEAGPQALLPSAFSGDYAWWYGQPETGSFIGTQRAGDSLLSGGISEAPNFGTLDSPSIDLSTSISPLLRFRTWWEIESGNPNKNGFDVMEILISVDGGVTYASVRRLNPFVDPNDADRAAKPFSSGGFNRMPVWVMEEIDLSSYVGGSVVVRFDFNTHDELYNGFRGWILDDVEIVDFGVSGASQKLSPYSGNITKPNAPRERLGDAFWNVHKLPRAPVIETEPARQ